MSLPVVLRPEASRDVEEARDHLDAQHQNLGQTLLDSLNDTLSDIRSMPVAALPRPHAGRQQGGGGAVGSGQRSHRPPADGVHATVRRALQAARGTDVTSLLRQTSGVRPRPVPFDTPSPPRRSECARIG